MNQTELAMMIEQVILEIRSDWWTSRSGLASCPLCPPDRRHLSEQMAEHLIVDHSLVIEEEPS